ncbi:pentapeptide repeat-containing protein [Streptomyces sp. NPDC051738]|uniref:pentapeptide repeat-containing protein n=1 Tax=Streptomyces sp. NPDC051738 TaxID=3365672 RepID=UPI0037D58653
MIVLTWLSLQQVDNEQALTRSEHALTREGQVTDRYNNAVSNIGDDSREVRLGGIYALQRIMEDSSRDQPAIINVLSTYIRNHAQKPKHRTVAPEVPASDIQAALTALGSRSPAHDGTALVDLRGTYLRGADLDRANLQDAKLDGADLLMASLSDAHLGGADLADVDLRASDLTDADLTDAVLDRADLRFANLRGADLTEAKMVGVYVRSAKLQDANLQDALVFSPEQSDPER